MDICGNLVCNRQVGTIIFLKLIVNNALMAPYTINSCVVFTAEQHLHIWGYRAQCNYLFYGFTGINQRWQTKQKLGGCLIIKIDEVVLLSGSIRMATIILECFKGLLHYRIAQNFDGGKV